MQHVGGVAHDPSDCRGMVLIYTRLITSNVSLTRTLTNPSNYGNDCGSTYATETCRFKSGFWRTFWYLTRIEEFAKEETDLTLSTALEIKPPEDDLSDVKTMMDSISVVPGVLVHSPAADAGLTVCTTVCHVFKHDEISWFLPTK